MTAGCRGALGWLGSMGRWVCTGGPRRYPGPPWIVVGRVRSSYEFCCVSEAPWTRSGVVRNEQHHLQHHARKAQNEEVRAKHACGELDVVFRPDRGLSDVEF